VETEHVRDRRAERPGVAIAAASGDELDQRVSIALPYADRARSARDEQRRFERARVDVEPIRRQLGNAVRNDRAREVDRLDARADEWDLREDSHTASMPSAGSHAQPD